MVMLQQDMKASIDKLSEETDLQFYIRDHRIHDKKTVEGLTYLSQSQTNRGKIFWSLCLLTFTSIVLGLLAHNLVRYYERPMGINQKVEKSPMGIPKLSVCFRWAILSNAAVKKLNISADLARVLQWRIEATYLVDSYPLITHYSNRSEIYPGIVHLLKRTRSEYLEIMSRHGLNKFEELVWFLRLHRFHYPWMKFKTPTGNVTPEHYPGNKPNLFSYLEVEMGYATFICELVHEAEKKYAAEVPITYPKYTELRHQRESVMTPIFLSLSRMVTVKDQHLNTIARVRPGNNCFVTYSIRTFEYINSREHPCIGEEDYCREACTVAAVRRTFPGCEHCQSLFTRIKYGDWSHVGDAHADLSNLTLCDPWEYAECDFRTVEEKRLELKKCTEACRPQCRQTQYSYLVQRDFMAVEGTGPRQQILSRLILEPEKGPLKSMLVQQYEILSIPAMLSDFGGYLGLFLGSSLLTVVHLASFCAFTAFAVIRGKLAYKAPPPPVRSGRRRRALVDMEAEVKRKRDHT